MLYYGTITAVYPPGTKQNFNKYQYEYSVLITGETFVQIPLNHVLVMDEFGSFDNFNDRIFRIGQTVCVMAFKNNLSQAFIIGAMRVSKSVTDAALGYHWRRRFNAVEQTIDKSGNWSIKLDQGDNIKLTKQSIVLDNSTGESIVIDKNAKSITVQAGKDWTMTLGGAMTVNAAGNVTLNCAQASINASGDVEVKAGGTAKVDADSISLNGNKGDIVTTVTSPYVDLLTGLPTIGVPTVKAG